MTSAEILSDKIDALGDALRAAGVAPERVTSLLAAAATAALHALVIDAMLEDTAAAGARESRTQPFRITA